MVIDQARAALQRYGYTADIRVITFYNMQKRDLEREFRSQGLSTIRIASVSLNRNPGVKCEIIRVQLAVNRWCILGVGMVIIASALALTSGYDRATFMTIYLC